MLFNIIIPSDISFDGECTLKILVVARGWQNMAGSLNFLLQLLILRPQPASPSLPTCLKLFQISMHEHVCVSIHCESNLLFRLSQFERHVALLFFRCLSISDWHRQRKIRWWNWTRRDGANMWCFLFWEKKVHVVVCEQKSNQSLVIPCHEQERKRAQSTIRRGWFPKLVAAFTAKERERVNGFVRLNHPHSCGGWVGFGWVGWGGVGRWSRVGWGGVGWG